MIPKKEYRMNIMKLSDIPIHELGNQIEIAGMVMQGQGKTYNILFPKSEVQESINIPVSHEEWKALLYQIDTLEVKLFPGNYASKVVVRKSQRNIEADVSWNVFRRDNYTCRYCGKNDVPMSVDHIILWEDMGASVEQNLNCSCRKCNKTRGNMQYEDWLKSDYYNKVIISSEIHELNIKSGETAKLIPLRVSIRNR